MNTYDIFTISFSETLQVHKSFTVHTEACEAGKTDYENCPSPKCKSYSQETNLRYKPEYFDYVLQIQISYRAAKVMPP